MLTMSKEGKTWPQRRFWHYSSCVLILPGGLQNLSRSLLPTVHVAGPNDPYAQSQMANQQPPVTLADLTDASKWDKLDLRNLPSSSMPAEVANLHAIHSKGMITDDMFSFGLWGAVGVNAKDACEIMKMRMERTPTRVKAKGRWELFGVATLSLWADGLTEILRGIAKFIDVTTNALGGWTHEKLVPAPAAAA